MLVSVSNRWRHLQQKANKKLRHLVLFQLTEIKRGFGEQFGFSLHERLKVEVIWNPQRNHLSLAWHVQNLPLSFHGTGDAGPLHALLNPPRSCSGSLTSVGKGWTGQGKSWGEDQVHLRPPTLGDSLKKTSGWARRLLKISFRAPAGHGLSLNLTNETGSLQIRVWGCPSTVVDQRCSPEPS